MTDLYAHLIDRGMVWEFRDLVQAHLAHSVPNKVLNSVMTDSPSRFPTKLANVPPRRSPLGWLRERWSKIAEDESTSFALLDVCTALALCWRDVPAPQTNEEDSTECMNAADEYGSALCALDDAHLMTRPCLRWIMAKRMIKDNPKLLFDDQTTPGSYQSHRGLSIFAIPRRVFPSGDMPIYVPINDFIPNWSPRPTAPGDDFGSVAHMVMRAAEVLGDLDLQTACLQELLYRGLQPPKSVIPTLRGIWVSTGNKRKLPWLSIFRAVLAHTSSAREEVQRDLLLEIGTGSKEHLSCQLDTLRALTQDPARRMAYLEMGKAIYSCGGMCNASSHDRADSNSASNSDDDDGMDNDRRKKPPVPEASTRGPKYRRSPSPPPPPVPVVAHPTLSPLGGYVSPKSTRNPSGEATNRTDLRHDSQDQSRNQGH